MARWVPIFDHPNVLVRSGQTGLLLCVGAGLLAVTQPWSRFDAWADSGPDWLDWVSYGLLALWLATYLWIWRTFSDLKSPWNSPKRPTKLGTTGPYGLLRNPGEVASAIGMLGFGLLIGSWPLLAAVPVWALVIHLGCVLREEHFFARDFAEDWEPYAKKVRRYGVV